MPSISVTTPEAITEVRLGTSSPKLGGTIDLSAFRILKIINGESNNLASFQNYSHLTTLEKVELSSNLLTGDLPDFSSNTSSKIIDIRSNRYAGVLTTSLPTGIQSFKANNNNFAKVNVSALSTGEVYSTILTATSTLAGGGVFTKTNEETFTIVSTSATSAAGFVNFVNSSNGLQVGKHRMTFDLVVNTVAGQNAGEVNSSHLKIDVRAADLDADSPNAASYVGGPNGFKIQPGCNVYDFEIFNDGADEAPNISFKMNTGAILDLSFTNFKIIRDPAGYGLGIHDFSTLTSLAEYQTANQSDSFGTSINTYGHASNANKVLNWSGPGELTNTSVDAGSIEGAIPESIRIINLEKTNISKDSKRILLTQLYDTFNLKPTNWAKTTTVNGVTYSAPEIKVNNDRGSWNDTVNGTNPWQKLLGKHSAITIGTAKAKLADVGFNLTGF